MHRGARRTVAMVAAVAMGTGVAACGDDAETAETAEFCTAFVGVDQGIETLPWEDPDALAAAYEADLVPQLDTADATAPSAIAGAVALLTGAVRTAITTGDFSVFEDPAVVEAQSGVFGQLPEVCDLPVVTVTALDFSFEGMPAAVEGGLTVIHLRNDGEELHEIALARVADGVDLSAQAIFEDLPEDEAFGVLEFRSGTSAPAGALGGTTIDLDPGRYVVFCMIPLGSVDGYGDGPPHVTQGMYGEFTVS